MRFHGQTVNLEWEHATDVYGERQKASDYKTSYDGKGRRFGRELLVNGSPDYMKGLKKEIIELRLYVKDAFGKESTVLEKCYYTYDKLRIDLYKYEILQLTYPQFMQWINSTEDSEVMREPDYVRLNFKIAQSQYDKHHKKDFSNETPNDILLPRGV